MINIQYILLRLILIYPNPREAAEAAFAKLKGVSASRDRSGAALTPPF